MFQYAAARSLQREVGVVIERERQRRQFAEYVEYFAGVKIVMSLPDGVRVYKEPRFAYMPFPDELKTGDWVIEGFFQSWRYFDEPVVRSCFCLTDARRKAILSRYPQLRDAARTVGVSVRHGKDYLEISYMHPFVGERYFRSAVASFSADSVFIVCSDDLPWCKAFFDERNFPGRTFVFVEELDVIGQLSVQALCGNNILSNSSFSWWGGWLRFSRSKERVVAPSEWFGVLARRRKMDWRDIYLLNGEVVDSREPFARHMISFVAMYWLFFRIWGCRLKKRVLS